MNITLEIPSNLIHMIDGLKQRPDESPVDVIARLVEAKYDDDYLDEETLQIIEEGLEEYKQGKAISHEELGKRLSII